MVCCLCCACVTCLLPCGVGIFCVAFGLMSLVVTVDCNLVSYIIYFTGYSDGFGSWWLLSAV